MKISKGIAAKAARYHKLKSEADNMYEELAEWFENNMDSGVCWNDFYIVDKPKGDPQGSGEYCWQVMEFEDSGHGTYYWPIKNSKQYLAADYEF